MVELLGSADQPEHALLNEVLECEALSDVVPGNRHDETEVRVDEQILRGQVATLDALSQIDLLVRREQLVAARAAQKKIQRISDEKVRSLMSLSSQFFLSIEGGGEEYRFQQLELYGKIVA